MSELITASGRNKEFRWQLLTTVSTLALIGGVTLAFGEAQADESDEPHPVIWIELGAQLEGLNINEDKFTPPFILKTPRPSPETVSPLDVTHPPRFSMGGEAKISFEPEDTNWVFTAAVRYGRSNAHQHLRQQTYPTHHIGFTCSTGCAPKYQRALQFMDTAGSEGESHAILDFQAGKDLGIGMFGKGSSVFSLGIRFAQFHYKSNIAFKSDPDAKVDLKYVPSLHKSARMGATYHSNQGQATATRGFEGFGPSISWSNSNPLIGRPRNGQLALDWGLNAAMLFGRQKARVKHQATAQYHKGKYYNSSNPNYRTTIYQHRTAVPPRSHNVIVPNIGGFAGLSFQFVDAKVSIGYRGDFFFNAMDGGVDKRKSENVGFYGPFATISMGFGG